MSCQQYIYKRKKLTRFVEQIKYICGGPTVLARTDVACCCHITIHKKIVVGLEYTCLPASCFFFPIKLKTSLKHTV